MRILDRDSNGWRRSGFEFYGAMMLRSFFTAFWRRSIVGVVSDVNGNPLRLARVDLRNLKTFGVLHCISGEQGDFHFDGLSMNVDYQIIVMFGDNISLPVRISSHSPDCELFLRFEPEPSAVTARLTVISQELGCSSRPLSDERL